MTDQLEPAVRTLIDAANAGDIDTFLAGFTTDGVVDDWAVSSAERNASGRGVMRSSSASA
jgi:hypothetical protein